MIPAVVALILVIVAGVWCWRDGQVLGHWPDGGTNSGIVLGIVAAAIVLFEMLLWPRKRFPKLRTLPLLPAKLWMKWHIWLGIAVLPLMFLHSGWRFGGLLTTWLAWTMIAVVVSGLYGLVLQHTLPRRMRQRVEQEVPYAEIDSTIEYHVKEFERRLEADLGNLGSVKVAGATELALFYRTVAHRYLKGVVWQRPANSENSADFPSDQTLKIDSRYKLLQSPASAAQIFDRLMQPATLSTATQAQEVIPPESHRRLQDLRELCDLRRQLSEQQLIHGWLHGWIWFHLPASIVLTVLLIAHVFMAWKYL